MGRGSRRDVVGARATGAHVATEDSGYVEGMADEDDDGSYAVTFLPGGETIAVPKGKGKTVLDAALDGNIDIVNACGGAGACSLCEVWLRDDPAPPQARLACEIEVDGALVVELR